MQGLQTTFCLVDDELLAAEDDEGRFVTAGRTEPR